MIPQGRRSGYVVPSESLFANGELGWWFDPADLSTLFTDTAAVGVNSKNDAIALPRDKSGNGLGCGQNNGPARPLVKYPPHRPAAACLSFDGVDDVLTTVRRRAWAIAPVSGFRGGVAIQTGRTIAAGTTRPPLVLAGSSSTGH